MCREGAWTELTVSVTAGLSIPGGVLGFFMEKTMLVANLFIKFMIFSFMGWVYECFYCAVKSGHWDNRGFLIGPICPIYGFGATGAMLVFNELPIFTGADPPIWKIFLVCALGSAILEYSISLILEKVFHAMWWDYSDMPLNINGRICVPATTGFGVAGVVIVKFFFPWFLGKFSVVETHPYITELTGMAFAFLLGMDLALSIAAITQLLSYLDDVQEKFDEKMEASVEAVAATPSMLKEKVSEAPAALKEKVSEMPTALKEKVSEVPVALKEKMGEVPQYFKDKAAGLSYRQRYHLRSIKTFKVNGKSKWFERLRKEIKDDDIA